MKKYVVSGKLTLTTGRPARARIFAGRRCPWVGSENPGSHDGAATPLHGRVHRTRRDCSTTTTTATIMLVVVVVGAAWYQNVSGAVK